MTIKGVDLATPAAQQFIVGRVRGTISNGLEDAELVAALIAGPTGGRIHKWPLPETVPYPAMTIMRYGNADAPAPLGRNVPSVFNTVRLQVKAICEGYDESPIEEAASILNRLLDGQSAMIDVAKSGGGTYGTFFVEAIRESELLTDLPPEDDGTVYQHLGGIYQFNVSRVG